MDKTLAYSSIGILALVGLGFGLSLRSRNITPAPRVETASAAGGTAMPMPGQSAPTPAAAPAPPTVEVIASAASSVASVPASGSPPTEAKLMEQLRAIQGAAPLLSLRLAREGNERFPGSPDAAERTWHVVKSLTDLGRFDEARDEAKIMVEAFPKTSWAQDVHRHVLLHPPGPPVTVGD